MPRSRSRSFESITRSRTSWFARKTPLWRSSASTSVVLPWSTWAMMATLRRGFTRVSGFSGQSAGFWESTDVPQRVPACGCMGRNRSRRGKSVAVSWPK